MLTDLEFMVLLLSFEIHCLERVVNGHEESTRVDDEYRTGEWNACRHFVITG